MYYNKLFKNYRIKESLLFFYVICKKTTVMQNTSNPCPAHVMHIVVSLQLTRPDKSTKFLGDLTTKRIFQVFTFLTYGAALVGRYRKNPE